MSVATPLHLVDMDLEKAAVEVRFPHAFLLWDRAGVFWTEAQQKWPGATVQHAEPARTIFLLDNRTEATLELEAARIIMHHPKRGLDDFAEVAEIFLSMVVSHLAISQFARIGCRVFYGHKFGSRDEAAVAIAGTNIVNAPRAPQFGAKGASVRPEYTIHYDGKAVSATATLRVETRKISFQPAPGMNLAPIDQQTHHVTFDVDRYASTAVGVNQLKVRDWVHQTYHAINRDGVAFFGGS